MCILTRTMKDCEGARPYKSLRVYGCSLKELPSCIQAAKAAARYPRMIHHPLGNPTAWRWEGSGRVGSGIHGVSEPVLGPGVLPDVDAGTRLLRDLLHHCISQHGHQ